MGHSLEERRAQAPGYVSTGNWALTLTLTPNLTLTLSLNLTLNLTVTLTLYLTKDMLQQAIGNFQLAPYPYQDRVNLEKMFEEVLWKVGECF